MTEKLTYDPTPADAPELSEEEQNSLEVAEKLGEEEAKQYAGKFENAQELEKAYLEYSYQRDSLIIEFYRTETSNK